MRLARVYGGEFVDVEVPFDPGNVWEIVGPFTPLAAWMRPFLFRVLKPREIAVYLHICSYMQQAAISYVSLRELQRDFGLTNRHQLIDAIGQLDRLGFLLRKKGRVAKSRTEHDRNIFQRPSLEYTLLKLLEEDAIDGFFHPTATAIGRNRRPAIAPPSGKYIDKGILRALDSLIGAASVKKYMNTPAAEKVQVLKLFLATKLEAKRAAVAIAATGSEKDDANSNIRTPVPSDQGTPAVAF